MSSQLRALEHVISIHESLLDEIMRVCQAAFDLKAMWKDFSFGEVPFAKDSPLVNMLLHWLFFQRPIDAKGCLSSAACDGRIGNLRLNASQMDLLKRIDESDWSFFEIIRLDRNACVFEMQEVFDGQRWQISGRRAMAVYEPGDIIYTMPVQMEPLSFTVASLPTKFNRCVIPSIEHFMNLPRFRKLPSQDLRRKIALSLFKVRALVGGDSRENFPTISPSEFDYAIKSLKKEFPGIDSNKLAADMLSNMLIGSSSFSVCGFTMKELAEIPVHRPMLNSMMDYLCNANVIGGRQRKAVKQSLENQLFH